MFYIDILTIIISSIIIYINRKDILKLLKLTSIITIIVGYFLIILSNIIKIQILKKITIINIENLSNILANKFINRGLILILLGVILLILYVIISFYKYYNIEIKKRRIIKQ